MPEVKYLTKDSQFEKLNEAQKALEIARLFEGYSLKDAVGLLKQAILEMEVCAFVGDV